MRRVLVVGAHLVTPTAGLLHTMSRGHTQKGSIHQTTRPCKGNAKANTQVREHGGTCSPVELTVQNTGRCPQSPPRRASGDYSAGRRDPAPGGATAGPARGGQGGRGHSQAPGPGHRYERLEPGLFEKVRRCFWRDFFDRHHARLVTTVTCSWDTNWMRA